MAITISGANNVDKILATDGVLDNISGFNVVGVMTAANFDVTGKTTTGHLNIGSNIQIGNAGIITATTLVGNVQGNINHTSNLLLQISGSEKFRVGTSGQLGIGGANYGTSGQVLKSGGSGSAPTWGTISTDLVSDTSPQLGGLLESNGSNIKMADSDIIVLGTGNDLQISHTSNISRIRGATTNDIHIESAANFKVRHQDTDGSNAEDMLICTGDGSVELYHNNQKKLETKGYGIDITGGFITTGGSIVNDGGNIKFGTGSDLQIFHDNSNNINVIQCHNGRTLHIDKDNGSENMAKFIPDGAVELYHDNTLRAYTTNVGLHVNTIVSVSDNGKFRCGNGDDLEIYHDGSNSYIKDSGTGGLLINSSGFDVLNAADNEYMARFAQNGAVSLYYDNILRLKTIGGGNSADGIEVLGNAANSSIRMSTSDGTLRGILYANSSNLIGFLDNSGQWVLSVAGAGGNTVSYNHFNPSTNNTLDLGTSSARWRNIYTNDLNLSNEGSSNSVDNTWGDFTIQEGESDLFLINNRNGKKYKFNLTEVS